MQEEMERKLREALRPERLEVLDESMRHAGHAQAGGGRDTHFRVRIVAAAFAGKSRVERHRMVNAAIRAAWNSGLHALAIDAKAPGE